MSLTKQLLDFDTRVFFPAHIIFDSDNVESEDFEPGQGGVAFPAKPAKRPEYKRVKTENDIENEKMFLATDEEKNQQQYEYLKKFGL